MRLGALVGWLALANTVAVVGACVVSFADYTVGSPGGGDASAGGGDASAGGGGASAGGGGAGCGQCDDGCGGNEICARDPLDGGSHRCVNVDWARFPMPNGRAGDPSPNLSYAYDDAGTVKDAVTGLMWHERSRIMLSAGPTQRPTAPS